MRCATLSARAARDRVLLPPSVTVCSSCSVAGAAGDSDEDQSFRAVIDHTSVRLRKGERTAWSVACFPPAPRARPPHRPGG